MFDVGMGELAVIAIVAVLLLGPDRLPRAIAEGSRWLRALRDQAAGARREIVSAAELDPGITDDLRRTMSDLSDLHPRRLAASILSDSPSDTVTPAPPSRPVPPGAPASGGAAGGAASTGTPTTPAFDPDAT